MKLGWFNTQKSKVADALKVQRRNTPKYQQTTGCLRKLLRQICLFFLPISVNFVELIYCSLKIYYNKKLSTRRTLLQVVNIDNYLICNRLLNNTLHYLNDVNSLRQRTVYLN